MATLSCRRMISPAYTSRAPRLTATQVRRMLHDLCALGLVEPFKDKQHRTRYRVVRKQDK